MMPRTGAGAAASRRAMPERIRSTSVLGVVLAMVAMLFVPVAPANAAPGDFAWGTVYVDANKDGVITPSGPAGEADKGVAGAIVSVVDATDTVVATATTGADGKYVIASNPGGTGPYKVRVSTSGANSNVYAFSPDERAGAPNVSERALPADGENDFAVYPVWKLDAKLASGDDGIITGAAPWDPSDDEAGWDSGATNTRVRSSDIVAFNWTLTASSEDGSLGKKFKDAVFEQTIILKDGAVANFASLPAVCQTGSRIVAQPSGAVIQPKTDPPMTPVATTSVTLSCVLGEMGEGSDGKIFSTLVQPSAKSPNGSSFETSSRFYGVAANGAATAQPAPTPDVPPIDITAAPRYDIEKTGPATGHVATATIDGKTMVGQYVYYTIQISTDRQVGVEAFQQPLKIEESFWANRSVTGPGGETVGSNISDLKWYINTAPGSGSCIPSPSPRSSQLENGLVYGKIGGAGSVATAANSVRDSGVCSVERTGAADTGNYTLTFNNIDTSGLTYPTQTVGGQSLAAGPYYVASYRVQVFIPNSELDRAQGAADDGTGELSIFNRVGDFDPQGVSGASNHGSGVEPGYCDAGLPSDQSTNCDSMEDGKRSNNVAGPVTIRVRAGSWGKYNLNMTTGWAGGYTVLPDSGATHDGAGQVQPGQAYTTLITLQPSGIDFKHPQFCDVFDSTMMKLVPLKSDVSASNPFDDGLTSAVLLMKDGVWLSSADQRAQQVDWVTKYAHVDLSPDDPNNGTFDTPTNRYEGDWTKQREATDGTKTVCGQDGIIWSDTPSDDTNVVWTYSASSDYVLKAGDYARLFLTFEQRDEYLGGPHAAQKIPAGTVAANFAAVKTSSNYAPNWSGAAYIPGAGDTKPLSANTTRQPGENGSEQGDRWTVTRAQLRLQKRTIAETVDGEAASGVATYGVTGAAVAGKPVVWEITSTLTASSSPAAAVPNVIITDTLPKYVIYNEAGTQALASAGGFPMPTSATVNGDGTTTLVWNLGTRTPNQDLPVLKIATYTDTMAPPNTSAINMANIKADGIVPVSAHTDDHVIRIEQSGEVMLKKSVDRVLDLQNDNQRYSLEVKNFGETLAIQAPTIYEVLPYNGDATNAANVNRTPASAYAGTNRLTAAPVATDFDGTTPRGGTFYYTTVPGAQVPQRQQDDTDPSIWSTTFSQNATGFKFVSGSPLTTTANASKSGIKIVFQTDQASNNPGDIYTNRFTAISPTLNAGNQLLTSNTVTVRVVGFSLGDLIWFDLNRNGKYEAGTDTPVPAGVQVQVRNAAGAVVATTTTLGGAQQGRWVVNNLAAGDYYATIPASEFAAGGLLEGAIPSVNPVATPNTDANEGADHHAVADGAGVRSAGVVTLSADTVADPLIGEEPLGDNVAGLTLAPLTTDDFTNLTLDLALIPKVEFTVEKIVDGPAASYGVGPFQITVQCKLPDSTADAAGYPKALTFNGAGKQTLSAPLGSNCEASETGTGNATKVVIDPANGITLSSLDGQFAFTVTNTFDTGSLTIIKSVEGAGAAIGQTGRSYTFTVACVFNGISAPVQTVTITDDGTGLLTSEAVEDLPVGATCTITETSAGGADSTPQALQVVIDSDPDTVQSVGPFVNEFSAGTLAIAKQLDGDAKDDAFLLDQQYTLELVCQVIEGVDYFSGSVTLKPGAPQPVTVGDEPLLLPVGARCWIDGESVQQGAKAHAFNAEGYDDALVVVPQSDSAEPQALELIAVNTFDQATLTVSKKVVGPGTGKAYEFELVCTYPVQGADGIENVDYPLAAGDAKFKLKDAESKTITVPAGVSCEVTEVNAPSAATVTMQDSDDTTDGGAADGKVAELSGVENFVQVTNTFPNPPMVNTGSQLPAGAVWAGAGLLMAGAALLFASRRRVRAGLGEQDSGGEH